MTYLYVFIFLSVWACSIGHVAQAVQRPAPCPIVPARSVWYRVQTGAACPAFGRVCWCVAWSALYLARPALLPVLCSLSGCAGVGRGTPAGYIAATQPRPVSSAKNFQNKKGVLSLPTPSFLRKTPHPPLPISKISRKNKKTPTKGLCSVLYLPYKP